jgi:prepilin-type N-terminal cleavage/methylation domain-containing protein
MPRSGKLPYPFAAGSRVASCRNCGFTLLEVMVAMLLLAVIMTTSVSMLFLNIRGWEGLTEHTDATLREHLIEKRLGSMIHHLTPLVWQGQQQRALALYGDTRQLHFLSKAPRQYRAGGLFEYLLVEESTADQGSSLVLYYAPVDPNTSELTLPGDGARRVMMSGLSTVRFSYFGSKTVRESNEWHDSWESNAVRYPDLIRLTVGSSGDGDRTEQSYFRIHQDYPVIVQAK